MLNLRLRRETELTGHYGSIGLDVRFMTFSVPNKTKLNKTPPVNDVFDQGTSNYLYFIYEYNFPLT